MGRGEGHHSVSVVGGQGSQRMTDNQARNFRVGSERQSRDVLEQRQIRQQQMREQVSDALNRSATTAADRRARRNAIDSLSREQIESTAGRLNMNQYTLLNKDQQKWYTDATNARNSRQTNTKQTTQWTEKEKSQAEDLVSQINKLTDETRKYKPLDRRLVDNVQKRNDLVDKLVALAESKGFKSNLRPGQVFRGSNNMKELARFLGTEFVGM